MKQSFIYWLLALLLTLASAYYQRSTGPTYPVRGQTEFAGVALSFSFARSHGGESDQPVAVHAPNSDIEGDVLFKRYKTEDEWVRLRMIRRNDSLVAMLPNQPPAGKLEYVVELFAEGEELRLPSRDPIITRFKGDVPAAALVPHVILMFLAMLFSMRVGLEALRRNGRPRRLVFWTIGFLIAGGLIFGPIVQKYAFGEYWTGFPFGTDLTDNKTLIAFIAWLVAVAAVWNAKAYVAHPSRRLYVLAASFITLLVYLIPHSMMGSELDYQEYDRLMQEQHVLPVDTGNALMDEMM